MRASLVERWFSDQLLNMYMFGVQYVFQCCLWQLPSLTWAAMAAKSCHVKSKEWGRRHLQSRKWLKSQGWDHSQSSEGLPRAQFLLLMSSLKSIEWRCVSHSIESRLSPAAGEPRGGASHCRVRHPWNALNERSAASPAPWPRLTRVGGGPCRPPSSSARLRCGTNPSASASAPGSAAIGFSAKPGWKHNGRHQGLAGNGDHDRYSPWAGPPRPVRMPGLVESQPGGKGRVCGGCRTPRTLSGFRLSW